MTKREAGRKEASLTKEKQKNKKYGVRKVQCALDPEQLVSPRQVSEKGRDVLAMPMRIVVFISFNFVTYQITINLDKYFMFKSIKKIFKQLCEYSVKHMKEKINLKTQSH